MVTVTWPCLPTVSRADQVERIGEEFGKTLRTIDEEKAHAEAVLSAELAAKLQAAIQEWLASARETKTSELNQAVDQHWELLPEMFGSPVRYEYYLKDFAYGIDHQDVVRTTSMIAAYKATVQFRETLHVSRYHPDNISDLTLPGLRYTVITPIAVDFEYQGERVVVTRAERGQPAMTRGWQ